MSEGQTCIVVGAGHAGAQLALQLRRLEWPGRIVLVGEENELPYHRPPLSKAVLAGDKEVEDIPLRPETKYRDSDVEMRLGCRVEELDRERRTVTLSDGETLSWDRLALCTGSRVIRLPLGEGLEGVHYLRRIEDVRAIRASAAKAERAVIIGGGYIGLEAAAVLAGQGLQVTVLEREERVLKRVTGPETADYVTRLHRAHGVDIVCNAEVTGINGEHAVESVSCADGSHYPAELVIVGVGIRPETTLAEQAGLDIENGIRVDEYTRTSDENLFAAGDCTSHPSVIYGRRLRLESVQNANDQSRVAASNICGKPAVYDSIPWFWTDQYGIKLQAAGLSEGFDETLAFGELDPDNPEGFTLVYLREGRMIAADCVNQAKVFMQCKRLVQEHTPKNEVIRQLTP